MLSVEEIRKQIEENERKIEELKAKSETAIAKWNRLTYDEKLKHIKEEEKTERARKKEIKYTKEIVYILQNNYRAALVAVALPALLEIVNKYAGKQAGEKTRVKIAEEMRAACGCSFFFNYNTFGGGASRGTLYDSERERIEIYSKTGRSFIDEENTINRIKDSDIFVANVRAYVEDPAARLGKIRAARDELEQEKKSYNEAADRLNALIVDGMEEAKKIC